MRPIGTAMLLAAATCLAGGSAGAVANSGVAAGGSRLAHLPWHRSKVVGHGRVVRIAVSTGAQRDVAHFAYVRRTPHTVRIKLIEHRPTGLTTGQAILFCVEVHLRFSAAHRERVDASTGRAPDRARPGSPEARQRDDTRSVDLTHGPCERLRPRYLRPWTR